VKKNKIQTKQQKYHDIRFYTFIAINRRREKALLIKFLCDIFDIFVKCTKHNHYIKGEKKKRPNDDKS